MKILFATAAFASQYQLLDYAENILEAWPKAKCEPKLTDWLEENPDPDRIAMLDSGVFSTWTLGQEVPIDDYIKYCKDNTKLFSVWVNVDVIPGKPGQVPTAQMVDKSAQKGWDNWMYLMDKGLDPARVVHVFHQNESFKWLEKLVEYQEKHIKDGYIGISPANDRTAHQRMLWLEQVMPYVTHKDGSAKIKFHGFGATSMDILRRYPWYCMTEDHEVLTKFGWQTRDELKVGDEILAFVDGESEWQAIQEVPVFDVQDADLINFTHRTCEGHFTPDHRWRVQQEHSKRWEWRTTEQLTSSTLIPRSAKYRAPSTRIYSDDFVELFAWYWTEGTINKRPEYKKPSVSIYQSEAANKANVDRIQALLTRMKEAHCCSSCREGEVTFELYGEARDKLLEISPNKQVPMEFVLGLTSKQLELFVEVSVLGDGWKTNLVGDKNSFGISQNKGCSLETFQIACLLAGKVVGKIRQDGDSTEVFETCSVKWINRHAIRECNNETQTKYTGKLWCVRIPSGAFFTRCRGTIYVTGNTCDSTSWMRAGAYGSIRVPLKGKKFPYLDSKLQVTVTAGAGETQADRHYEGLSKEEKAAVCEYLDGIGVSIDDVKKDGNEGVKARQYSNMIFWKNIEKDLDKVDQRWKPIQESFI